MILLIGALIVLVWFIFGWLGARMLAFDSQEPVSQ